ncbi:MAG: hypothetical protein WB290_08400, partial [Smithella sp.]
MAVWCCENSKGKPDLKIMTPDKIIITLTPVQKIKYLRRLWQRLLNSFGTIPHVLWSGPKINLCGLLIYLLTFLSLTISMKAFI